ncbi:MAG: hypothetical protein VYD54_06990 [Bdellovibrionota bacterium]|nr:hypothetical protein [Bdellovibrionota bacterium]
MKNIWLLLLFFSFCIKGHSEDWLPNGMIVDKNGNIIHKVEMDKSFNSPKEELTTLAFVAQIEQGRSIVNLSKSSSFKVDAKYNENAPPPNDGSGFLVIQSFKVGAPSLPIDFLAESTGAVTLGEVMPTVVAPQIGIMLSVKAGMVGKLHVAKYKDIDNLPTFLSVPYDMKTLNKYKIGDSMTYEVGGGLGLMLGHGANTYAQIKEIGIPIAVSSSMIGVGAIVEGEWICNVKKTGKTTVQARYIKKKIKKMSVFGGASLLLELGSFEASKLKGVGTGSFYEFDISKPEGLKAYQNFLRGNILYAFHRANHLKSKIVHGIKHGEKNRKMKNDVRPLMEYDSTFKGKEKRKLVSFPFLFGLQSKRGEHFVQTETRIPQSDTTIKTSLGVYRAERDSFGLLRKDYYRLFMFAGNHQRVFRKEGAKAIIQKRFSGNFKYFYHNGNLLEGELENEIMKMASSVGFKKELVNLKINQAAVNLRQYFEWKGYKVALEKKNNKKVLGTTKISADLMIGMTAIKELMSKALTGYGFEKNALQRLDNWFADKNNKRWEVCFTLLKGKEVSLARMLCKKKMLKQTKKGMNLAYKSLIKMQGSLGKNDLKGFSKHFARFGKGMIKNQFTFRGILDNIRRGDYHFVIQWSGERVPRGEFVLVSSKKFRFKGLNRVER